MENSSPDSELLRLDENRSYCIFYIENNEIQLASHFSSDEDMIEILNVIRNTDVPLIAVCESLSETGAAQLRAILDAIKNNGKGKKKPVISPLSMSRQK